MKKIVLIFFLLEAQFSFSQLTVLNPDSLIKINFSNFLESNFSNMSIYKPKITNWKSISCEYGSYGNVAEGTQIEYKKQKLKLIFQKDSTNIQRLTNMEIKGRNSSFMTLDSLKVGDLLDLNSIDSGLLIFKKSNYYSNNEYSQISEIYYNGFYYGFKSLQISKFDTNPKIKISRIRFIPNYYILNKQNKILYHAY